MYGRISIGRIKDKTIRYRIQKEVLCQEEDVLGDQLRKNRDFCANWEQTLLLYRFRLGYRTAYMYYCGNGGILHTPYTQSELQAYQKLPCLKGILKMCTYLYIELPFFIIIKAKGKSC